MQGAGGGEGGGGGAELLMNHYSGGICGLTKRFSTDLSKIEGALSCILHPI